MNIRQYKQENIDIHILTLRYEGLAGLKNCYRHLKRMLFKSHHRLRLYDSSF